MHVVGLGVYIFWWLGSKADKTFAIQIIYTSVGYLNVYQNSIKLHFEV